jgi:hypothetical protein
MVSSECEIDIGKMGYQDIAAVIFQFYNILVVFFVLHCVLCDQTLRRTFLGHKDHQGCTKATNASMSQLAA